MKRRWYYGVFLILIGILAAECGKDNASDGDKGGTGSAEEELNRWIYKVMKVGYLWNGEISSSPDYSLDYEDFFQSLLKKPVPVGYSAQGRGILASNEPHDGTLSDNGAAWSPYSCMEAWGPTVRSTSGLHSFGFQFQMYSFGGRTSTKILAQVLYVAKNSPAEAAGLRRGDWIMKVNGTAFSLSNYVTQASKLMASAENTQIMVTVVPIYGSSAGSGDMSLLIRDDQSQDILLSAAPVDDNPVFYSKCLTLQGGRRVGYLVYNGFSRGRNPNTFEDDYNDHTYDDALKTALREMGDIDDLILDLRYNQGGYVLSCQLLGSMIAPVSLAGSVFNQKKDNTGHYTQDHFLSVAQMSDGDFSGEAGVNLNLERLYVLTSSRTASASEMLINSLRGANTPMTVYVVGDQTEGKNVGSYLFDKTTTAGTTYAGGVFDGVEYCLRPIGFQCFNAKGESDYANGFLPGTGKTVDLACVVDEMPNPVENKEYRLEEFGADSEPMLARAIALIEGQAEASQAMVRSQSGKGIEGGVLPFSSIDFKSVRGCIQTETDLE